MRAVVWHGKRDVRVEDVADPKIQEPTDAIVRVTTTAICGSDLHLYDILDMYMEEGDILGHEAMGVVQQVGPEVEHIKPGDRVVIPFNIACGHCWMCQRQLYSQCETTQVREHSKGAALFGYSKLYGGVPGGQAEYVRVPQAQFGPIKVPEGQPDERFVYLSDVIPTAWQAVEYANIPKGGSVAVLGLGPIGQMATRIARLHGVETIVGLDLVPERLDLARRYGVEVLNVEEIDDIPDAVRSLTAGRGPDSVIDAVGMEAHGSPLTEVAQKGAGFLPDRLAEKLIERAGADRLSALVTAISTVRRGGTLSITGVYGGAFDPLPMLELFDKQIQIRMGQANVKAWVDDAMPHLVGTEDPLGTEDLATHILPLEEAPHGYEIFQNKQDGCIKVLLKPGG